MKWCVVLAAAVLPMAGCAVQPGSVSFGVPVQYPGMAMEDPGGTLVIDGSPYDAVFLGGRWGYYDRYHHFRDAPDRDRRRFESRYPRGEGFRGHEGGGFAGRGGGGFAGRGGGGGGFAGRGGGGGGGGHAGAGGGGFQRAFEAIRPGGAAGHATGGRATPARAAAPEKSEKRQH